MFSVSEGLQQASAFATLENQRFPNPLREDRNVNRDMTTGHVATSGIWPDNAAVRMAGAVYRALMPVILVALLPAQAWSGQSDGMPDTLALPFTGIPEVAEHDSEAMVPAGPRHGFPVSSADEDEESSYHIGIGYTPESGGFGLQADAWEVQTDAVSLSGLTPTLMLEPSLSGNGEGPRLSDVNHDALLNLSGSPGRRSRGLDLTASYVWESSRFGEFVVSTRATYVYNQQNLDGLTEPGSIPATEHPLFSQVPELQSSLMLSWRSGNHQATATTHVAADSFDHVGDMNLEQLDRLVGHIATLDLRYGYNIGSGRKGNTRISVGLRNTMDNRPLQQLRTGGDSHSGGILGSNGSVAYGTIKYQF